MNTIKRGLFIGMVLLILIIGAWYIGLHEYLSLNLLRENRVFLENSVEQNYTYAVAVYLLVYIVVIAAAMPGVPVLTMLGGFLFGVFSGGIYALIGATIGTTVSFLLIRYVLGSVIRGKYAQKLERFNEKVKAHGVAWYLLTLQLMGLIPYFVINVLAALTDVPFQTFLWTTFVGSVPIIFIYAFAGRQLYLVESVQDIFSPSIIALLLVLVMLTLVPVFLRFSRRAPEFE